MPAVVAFLLALSASVGTWFCATVALIPIALIVARWGVLVGAGLGLVAAVVVLTGLIGEPRISTPESAVLTIAPDETGPAPLDLAWPSYLFLQFWYDLREIAVLMAKCTAVIWGQAWQLIPSVTVEARLAGGDRHTRWPAILLAWPLISIPLAGLLGATAGAMTSLIMVFLTAVTAAATIGACASLVLGAMTAWARAARRFRRSRPFCTACNRLVPLPAYACPGSHDRVLLHRRLRPGLSGIWTRRCGCGVLLPTTASRAARQLQPHCPRCEEPLYPYAGFATDLRLVVFGAPRAGKSSLLEAALRSITSDKGHAPVTVSRRLGTITLSFPGRGRPKVVHLFDPEGSDLLDPKRRQELRYLDYASSMLYVLDPFSIPGLRAAIEKVPGLDYQSAAGATDDPVLAFDAVIESLRSYGNGLSSSLIAVTVVKRDLLERVGEEPVEASSTAVRSWINRKGAGRLTWPVEHDFARHCYFLVSAENPAEASAPVRWLLHADGVGIPTRPKVTP